jgi:hypothetical protein
MPLEYIQPLTLLLRTARFGARFNGGGVTAIGEHTPNTGVSSSPCLLSVAGPWSTVRPTVDPSRGFDRQLREPWHRRAATARLLPLWGDGAAPKAPITAPM